MKFSTANVATLLYAMQSRKVLVIGDVMLDRFIDGSVTRISPEAPVPILSQSGFVKWQAELPMWLAIWLNWDCMFT